MKCPARFPVVMLLGLLLVAGCKPDQPPPAIEPTDHGQLVGAWRSKIVFQSGPLAGMKDLEFLHSYNAGGTMTESSNYDEAANSSPPAYGIWKQIASRTFQTKYVFYTTKEPGLKDGTGKGDWWPAGHGVLTETITVSADGQSYTSTIKLVTYDKLGAQIGAADEGTGTARRVVF